MNNCTQTLITILVIALFGICSYTTERGGKPSNRAAIPEKPVNPGATVNVIQVTDRTYDTEVLRSSIPVLIFFWAPWSAPDRMMVPALEAVAVEYTGRVKVGKVNVDENVELSRKFGIKAIPTLVLIEHGSEQQRVVGGISKEAIKRVLEKQLGNP